MTRNLLLASALICFSMAVPMPAHAQAKEEPKKEAAPAAAPETAEDKATEKAIEKAVKNTPNNVALQKWIDAENALIKPLSDRDKESFFILRNKYSIMRVINVVERDVGAAVKSCGDKNADMKDKMDTRFKQWRGAVLPILDTAKKQLDKDIDAQKIVDPKKVKEVLKLNDVAYEESEKKIVKTPVTTKEACQGLLDSMDRTEDDMVKLLQQSLLTESVIRSRVEAAEKEKAASDAKKKQAETKPEKKAE